MQFEPTMAGRKNGDEMGLTASERSGAANEYMTMKWTASNLVLA